MVLNGNCVTVVASTGLHFRIFHLLTSASSHDLKETIDKDYCECGTPSLSVVPLLLGDSDSLSVSYGMEPEQEALSIVSFKN